MIKPNIIGHEQGSPVFKLHLYKSGLNGALTVINLHFCGGWNSICKAAWLVVKLIPGLRAFPTF